MRTILLIGNLVLAASVLSFPHAAVGQCQRDKLHAIDGETADRFGDAVQLSGRLLVVGSPLDDDHGDRSGSAFVFVLNQQGQGTLDAKLLAADGAQDDLLGNSVAVEADRIALGADGHGAFGAAYVFECRKGAWEQVARLVPEGASQGASFGESISMSEDVIVGGAILDSFPTHAGAAFVFERQEDGEWLQTAKLRSGDPQAGDHFGIAVDVDGAIAVVGACNDDDRGDNAGAAFVFERQQEGGWYQTTILLADDGQPGDDFGGAVAVSSEVIVVGAHDVDARQGAVYVFERLEDDWVQTAKLQASDGAPGDWLGRHLDVDGDLAVVGAFGDDDYGANSGAAYLFRRESPLRWTQVDKITAADAELGDVFGRAVGLRGRRTVIGAWGDDDRGEDAGAAYVVDLTAIGADVDCDGVVDLVDRLTVLASWGACPEPPAHCRADIDGDGVVRLDDLVRLLADWG